VHSNKLAKP